MYKRGPHSTARSIATTKATSTRSPTTTQRASSSAYKGGRAGAAGPPLRCTWSCLAVLALGDQAHRGGDRGIQVRRANARAPVRNVPIHRGQSPMGRQQSFAESKKFLQVDLLSAKKSEVESVTPHAKTRSKVLEQFYHDLQTGLLRATWVLAPCKSICSLQVLVTSLLERRPHGTSGNESYSYLDGGD